MKLDFYQIDAFTDTLFGGNPAVVVPLKEWLPDALLLKITQENAVAETAFFVDKGEKYICVGLLPKSKWTCVVTPLWLRFTH